MVNLAPSDIHCPKGLTQGANPRRRLTAHDAPAASRIELPRRRRKTSGGRSRRRLENRRGALRVEPARRGQRRSVAVDAAAIALVVIARQPVGIVVDLDGRNESGRGHRGRVSVRQLRLMESVVMLRRCVRRTRRKGEAHRKRHRREFHSSSGERTDAVRHLSELDFIEWSEETTGQADAP
jgi:hypothetical protein